MNINLTACISLKTKAKLTKEEKYKLEEELEKKIKANLELLMSDIPIPNYIKLLDGYNYDVEVETV